MDITEYITHWKLNTVPPTNDSYKYDLEFTPTFTILDEGRTEELSFRAVIFWEPDIMSYVFLPIDQHTSEHAEIVVSTVICEQIQAILRDKYGIYVTRGLFKAEEIGSYVEEVTTSHSYQ